MECPRCDSKTEVINSRTRNRGEVYRRRECPQCEHRFTTYELHMVADNFTLFDRIRRMNRQRVNAFLEFLEA